MTVCIAATCTWLNNTPVVVAASDRMITVGDVEFEPPQTKVYLLSNSLAMLISGDTAIQTELAKRAKRRINDLIIANVGWVFVEIAARIVGRTVAEYRSEMTQRLYLEPFGLTHATLLEKQSMLAPDWLRDITGKVLNYVPGISCIITGLDTSGAHIYTVDGLGRITCHDAAGFAAIGGGRRHAESGMMFSGHTARNALGDTLFLTYAAKKESEVSPGVGQGTDMFIVPQLGALTQLPEEAVAVLDHFYEEMKATERAARQRATAGMVDFLTQKMKEATTQPQEGDDTPAPPDATSHAESSPSPPSSRLLPADDCDHPQPPPHGA